MNWTVLTIILSYLLGGLPTALIAGKMLRGIDIREFGSKNAGATNAWRVLGRGVGSVVLLIDAAKGVSAVLLVPLLAEGVSVIDAGTLAAICGFTAIAGHIWTPFAGFRGGKGVGTAGGVLGAFAPWCVLIALVTFVSVVAITRYISAGSLAATLILSSTILAQHILWPETVPLAAAIVGMIVAVIVFVKHRGNIRRLIDGNENRFVMSKQQAEPPTVADAEG
jgi:acyl phosphate:glycerol-3-phosphate acyltransferase